MQDLGLAFLILVSLSVLVVFVSAAIVAEHSSAVLPPLLSGRVHSTRKRSLLIEIPFVAVLLVGGELVVILFLTHPDTLPLVKLAAAAQLVAMAAWLAYLTLLVARSRRRGDSVR